jgi:hypothetical protein
MYIYDRQPSGSQSRSAEQPISVRPAQSHSYGPGRVVSEFLGGVGTNGTSVWPHAGLGQLTAEELSKKLQHLSLLPHVTVVSGKHVALTPSVMDPNIYAGSEHYEIAPKLQDCLKDVMKKERFRPIKVALVDLTKGLMQPEFAGSFDHKKQVYVASVGKIATMLGAFQLRQDLRGAWNMKGAKTLAELFARVREDWAATQRDPGGKATPFTSGVTLRGKLVLWNGGRVALRGPKSPRLETIFRPVLAGLPIEFSSTGENEAQLQSIVDEYHERLKKATEAWTAAQKALGRTAAGQKQLEQARQKFYEAVREARKPLDGLDFWERLGIVIGGDVPVSNRDLHDRARRRLSVHRVNTPSVRALRY